MVALSTEDQHHAPLPLDPLGKKFCQLFPYLWQPIVGQNEPDPNWQTITKYPMRPRVLWRQWQDANQLVGVRFDSLTCYGMLDIDRQSPYHPANDPTALKLIRAALETIGLYRSILIRSSFSEGLHLYIPLPIPMPTFGIASAIRQCLEAQGLEVKAGQLEIFPNCKAFALPGTYTEYNAHRLPLQPNSGSCLLDDDGSPINGGLERFFQSWDMAAVGQSIEELQGAIAIARSSNKVRRHRRATIVEDWRNDLQTEIQEGWTGHGQTNHLLKTIACYGVVFEGLKGDALSDFVQETAIGSPGYEQWCRHQHEIGMRSKVWARSTEGYYWKLGDPPSRSGSIHGEAPENNVVPFNTVRSEDAQRRIRETVKQLEQEGQLPLTATARMRAIVQQGISSKTLYRHLDLWHPTHYQSDPLRVTRRDRLGSCKTSELEVIPAIFEGVSVKVAESSKPFDSKGFYTLKGNMKSVRAETGSSPNFSDLLQQLESPELPQTPRRDPSTNFSAVGKFSNALQLSLLEGLLETPPAGVYHSSSSSREQVWVLVKLLQMWMDGYQNFVRLLRKRE
ncbi:hypothetical protein [Phormidesmis sp. 146-33]